MEDEWSSDQDDREYQPFSFSAIYRIPVLTRINPGHCECCQKRSSLSRELKIGRNGETCPEDPSDYPLLMISREHWALQVTFF
jgi:hypothetical protein